MICRKTATILCASLGGSLLLLVLLAGFVPQTEGPEVRRKASDMVVHLQPQDLPSPIVATSRGGRSWAVRQMVQQPVHVSSQQPGYESVASRDAAASGMRASIAAAKQHVVSFGPDGVRLVMGGQGLLYSVAPARSTALTPLLPLDGASQPVLLTAQPQEYGDSLDAQGRPVRWASEQPCFTAYSPRVLPAVLPSFGLWPVGDSLSKAQYYRQLVEDFSRRYGLDMDLVFAIIHSESNFRPTLVSSKSAMGLMQLLPSTAGGEVHRFLYGRNGNVGLADLSEPETNIRYGTAYLHILMTRYFHDVRDPLAREYCVVAAYNMGPNRLLRIFGKDNSEAVARINSMSAAELYEELTVRLPIRETRFYVAKVQHMKGRFAAGLD